VSKKRYDSEFKRNAVELLLSGSHDLKPLARNLGVCPVTLRNWRDRYLADAERSGNDALAGPLPREMAAELRRVCQENEQLKRQRDILKKALGIVSETPPERMP
jgi:transposase-like protein